VIYYRVACQGERNTSWKWSSTSLTSLSALLALLKMYTTVPREHIRVFFSTSVEEMDEMLTRENQGLVSTSVTADQLLSGPGMNAMDIMRLELELSQPGDHDAPYAFTLPTSVREALAWTKLLAKVQCGELVP